MSRKTVGHDSAQIMHIFFLCDTSGSMQGSRLAAQNQALAHALQQLRQLLPRLNINIRINVINYGDSAEWHYSNQPLELLYNWTNFKQAQGVTSLGFAYKLLSSRLKILSGEPGQLLPLIVLISDGKATDDADEWLDNLLRTRLGNESVRVAFALGASADLEALGEFDSRKQAEPLQNLAHFKRRLLQVMGKTVQLNCRLAQRRVGAVS